MGYGNEAFASDANVVFPMDLALPACRDLWSMADAIVEARGQLNTSVGAAVRDWLGPERDTFDTKVDHHRTESSNTADSLRLLARDIAHAWAGARGQQDRINFARYVEHEIADDGGLENFAEHFTGEDDYGPPPENPADPAAPGFAATREPIHPEFEHV